MKIQGIIHQQICQLRWHLLACLGMIMVLPIEEAIVNLRAGDGFHSFGMVYAALAFSPLLAGLIACANVQGDLNEKRYIFWRSKPANVKRLMALKFFVGLIVSLAIIACPFVFGFVSSALCGEDLLGRDLKHFVPILFIIAVMTYSLCFGCNVLVRNTARSWLVGMLLTGFVLVFPFMLPLGYTDIISDIDVAAFGFYPAIILIASAAAFVLAIYAAQHDWHLRTNLKSLLWVGGGLVFILMMLFSSQVANIKVLQEKEIESSWWQGSLDYAGDRIVYHGHSYIDDDKDVISFLKIGSGNVGTYGHGNIGTDSSGRRIHYGPRVAGYEEQIYPEYSELLCKGAGNEIFSFSIHAYFRREGQGSSRKVFYEKIYLRCYKRTVKNWEPICELDLSDYLTDNRSPRIAMRLIGDKIIVFIRRSFVVVDATDPGELKLMYAKLDVLKGRIPSYSRDSRKEFIIPLVPVEGIGIEEKIKLSIDWYYSIYIYEASIVDIHDGKISFFLVSFNDIARFDVTNWDDEKVYCRFSTSRPFTILEGMTRTSHFYRKFVKNGKLYCQEDKTLLVFDIRSNRRIRKLGHFVRMNYDIRDIAVLENGNILLYVSLDTNLGKNRPNQQKTYLYLLKNPE